DALEILADAPRPRPAVRVHVGEDPQDALAADRRRRKAVDVQPRVVLAPRALASGDLDRAKAGPRDGNAIAVLRQQAPDEGRCRAAESGDQSVENNAIVAVERGAAKPIRV